MLSLVASANAVDAPHPSDRRGVVHKLPHRRTALASSLDLDGYFHHSSRMPVGASTGMRLDSMIECTARCDELGTACFGFSVEDLAIGTTSKYCTIAAIGTGLSFAAGVDFYRKKLPASSVSWDTYHHSALPSDACETPWH